MSFLKRHYPLLLILLLALGLRLAALFRYGDFSFDEMFSFIYSQKSWTDSLRFWIWETNPPLHMALLKGWLTIFPKTELWTRLFSVTVGVATIALVYQLAKKLFSQPTAIWAALLIAINTQHIFISALGRGYALLLFLATLCIDRFYTLFFLKKKNKTQYLFFILSHTLLIYTHLTAIIILAGECLILILYQRDWWRRWVPLYCLIIFLWLPWAIPSFHNKATVQTINRAWFLNIKTTLSAVTSTFQPLFGGFNFLAVAPLIVIGGSLLIVWGIRRMYQQKQPLQNTIIILMPITLTFLVITLFGLWNVKFTMVILPLVTLLMAQSIVNLPNLKRLLICGVLCFISLATLYNDLPIQSWASLNRYIVTHTQTNRRQILVYLSFYNKIIFDRYYRGAVPALPYYPHELISTSWDNNVITKNYLHAHYSIDAIKSWAQIHNLENYQDIFIISNLPKGAIPLDTFLETRGWRSVHSQNSGPYLHDQTISLYIKN